MTTGSWTIRLLRFALGGIFVVAGAIYLAADLGLPVQPPKEEVESAEAFMQALRASGFIIPLMYIFFLAGGVATWFDRTAPLGLVILAPFIAVILFFHLMLTGFWIWGCAWAAIHLMLLWSYRARFAPLWTLPLT